LDEVVEAAIESMVKCRKAGLEFGMAVVKAKLAEALTASLYTHIRYKNALGRFRNRVTPQPLHNPVMERSRVADEIATSE